MVFSFLSSDDPVVMGIINVTPDSFSDGGKYSSKNKAIEHSLKLVQDGARILDIGGESTRPGAKPVDVQEEIDRVVPIVEGLHARLGDTVCLSVDTRNAATMSAVLAVGAHMINDVSALTHDTDSVHVLAKSDAMIVLMHMQNTPETMQDCPEYTNIISDISAYFKSRVSFCETSGIEKGRLILDVGIGFGKTCEHNLLIHRNIREFQEIGCPVLLGSSRKRFIADIDAGAPSCGRLGGSLASVLWAYTQGVRLFRVHDVRETVQALRVYQAISGV